MLLSWLSVRLLCLLYICFFFFFNDTATTEIYTLSLHDALPISCVVGPPADRHAPADRLPRRPARSARLRTAPGAGEAGGPKGLRVRAWPADPRSVHVARRGGRLPLHGCAGRPPVAHPVFGAPGGRGGRERPPVE